MLYSRYTTLLVYYTVAERPNVLSAVRTPLKLNTNTAHNQVGLGVFDACLFLTSLVLVVRIFHLRPRTVQWT